jgi:DNA-directed RNA polymerase subunit K/omega
MTKIREWMKPTPARQIARTAARMAEEQNNKFANPPVKATKAKHSGNLRFALRERQERLTPIAKDHQ